MQSDERIAMFEGWKTLWMPKHDERVLCKLGLEQCCAGILSSGERSEKVENALSADL